MSKGIIYQGQSLFDKTIESTGDVESSFAFALLNGVSVTEKLTIGQEVLFPEVKLKSIVGMFNFKNRPATDILNSTYELSDSLGIGVMIIESTFIIK